MTFNSRVLIVDDDDIIIGIITSILKYNNYLTEHCHSGEEALEKIIEDDYDLILLDVQMGKGLDGYETCKLMRELKPDLPIILVTANQDDESVNRGFESGSSDYIKKPVSRLELLARVKNTITLKHSEKKNLQLIETLRKDLTTAANIQKAMLPKWISIDGDLLFSSYYEASEAVGGDLFDWIKLDDNKYAVYIGDVSGHGVQAALLMSAIKSNIKHMIENYKDDKSLAELFTKLNERLCNDQLMTNNYLTIMMGVIDLKEGEFRFLNAGHPPLIVIDTISFEIRVHDEKGSLPLGWMQNLQYDDDDIVHIPLSSREIFLLFTDGIYECTNSDDIQFGIEGLKELIQERIEFVNCVTIPHKIKQYLTTNHYETSSDDFTLFSFQIHNGEKPDLQHPDSTNYYARHYTFVLVPALKEVEKVARDCEELVLDWTGDKYLAARAELIVDEFLNNIIMYGYNYVEDAEIVVEFRLETSKLSIRFWDKGIAWVPEEQEYSIDNPYDFEKDGLDTHGRGMKIIMSISNRFIRTRYDSINETKVEFDL